jgi:enamine deaminase RidA (YjgF/YER057c/UK114 family)
MAAQLEMAIDNVEAVLAAAGMSPANIVRVNAYATELLEATAVE